MRLRRSCPPCLTDQGWLYPAAVLDLFSRQVLGWSRQMHMQSLLVTNALLEAWFRRATDGGAIIRSDRGSQYWESPEITDTFFNVERAREVRN